MNIRPKNIPKFQNGGVPQWYLDRYGNRTALLGWDLNQRYNYADKNLMTNDHRNAGNLDTVYRKNIAYTGTPGAISSDIQAFYNSDGNGMSAEDFVNFYNKNAEEIRSHWKQDLTYNKDTAGKHNRLFRKMFLSRSNMSQSPGSDYNIGYLLGTTLGGYDIQDIEGSSTWLRRMDLYENEFNPANPDSNRLHEITLKDGKKAIVYKKANGDIGLYSVDGKPVENPETPIDPNNSDGTRVPVGHKEKYGPDWSKINGFLGKTLNNPNLWAAGRLAGNLINNARVYDEALKGIQPDLLNPYHTHRQVVGDEATKLSYYRQATAGETRAARPFTSDADRQVAYMNEAKRIGDELRAKGDLVDNAEIRRTSDESNQHQWANTQRDTEVANANRASINKANADRHRLLALKHSAQWSSIDNFLKELEYRKRQKIAEEQAFDNEIFALDLKEALIGDPRLIAAKKKVNDALKKANDNIYDPEVLKASNEYKRLSVEIAKEQAIQRKNYYNRGLINFAKSGTKIVHKKKDDLLYKSAKDVVEHFRKMSKIVSDDARKNKPVKIQKLASHPKGNTRKYLLGGLAPFTVYTPVALGGETSRTTTSETSSSKASSKTSDNAKNTLDLVKDLFKTLSGAGLPSDINVAYSSIKGLFDKAKLFGEEFDTDDIAGMYLSAINLINNVKYQKAEYDKALTIVNNKNAGQEVAIGANGIIVLNRETGKIEEKSLSELKNLEGYSVLTNNDLLHLRAMDTSKAFNIGMMLITTNATSMEEIGKFLKANLLSNIGSTEQEYSGLTKAQTAQVKAGLASLMNDNQTGDVKSKTQQALEELALRYLKGILPLNMKTLLDFNSLRSGISQEDLLKSLVYSGDTSSLSYSLHNIKEGKSGSGEGGSGSGLLGDIKSNFLDLVLRDLIGIDREFNIITKDGNSKLYSLNSKYISQLPNVSEDMSLDRMLGESKIGSIMDSRLGVTFGDQIISPENFKDIMFDLGGGATVVTLPCKYENGHKVVNFAIKDEFDLAVKEVAQSIPINYQNPQFIQALSKKLHEKGLDSLLSGDTIDPKMFGHFMVVSAYTSDKVKLDTNSRYIEKVKNPDSALEERLIRGLSTNKDKNNYELDVDDKFGWLELSYDDIYRGSVFIPLNNDPVSAQTGWGNDNIKLDETLSLANQYQNYQKRSKVKETSSEVL